MSVRTGCFVVAFLLFINCGIIQTQEEYQHCANSYWQPLEVTEPQLLKIEAPPPDVYMPCNIRFIAPEGKYVELDFKELDLGTLEMDYKHMNSCMMLPGIYLMDGWWDNTDSIGHPVCGKTNNLTSEQRIRRSTGRELGLIYFNNGGHFQVQFNIVDSPGKTVCPSSTVELSGSGTIKFPIKEDIYVNEEECSWKITASEGKRVKLTNKKNDIAGYRMYYPYNDCMASMHTGLQVFDNPTFTDPPMQEFCYGYIGRNVTEMTSSGNVVTLLFETSQTYFGTGFEMDYEEI